MTTHDPNLHDIQTSILRELLFISKARFAELNTQNISNDHFTFHVKRLQELGYIEKLESGEYQLTASGKEYAGRLDTDGLKVAIERQAKIGVLVVAMRTEAGEQQYLIQQRLKEPYWGFHGFMTGKVKWGETIPEGAAREFIEETGLTGTLEIAGVKHKMDYDGKHNLLEDKYFFVIRATSVKGNLQEVFPGGRNMWLTRKEIQKLPDLFDGVEESIEIVHVHQLKFVETKYIVKKY